MAGNTMNHEMWTEGSDDRESPEKRLWRAVFIQAFREALNFDEQAVRWLLVDEVDAPIIMGWADIEAEHVRPRIAAVLDTMATAVSRNRGPHYDAKRKRVEWRTPIPGKRRAAWRLLRGRMGRHIRFGHPPGQTEEMRKLQLERAILLSREPA